MQNELNKPNVKKTGAHKEPQGMNLGPEGETYYERLRTALALGEGFELFLCGFDAPAVFAEVKRRLAVSPPESTVL